MTAVFPLSHDAKQSLEPCRKTAAQRCLFQGKKNNTGGQALKRESLAPTRAHLGEDAEEDEPARASDTGPAGRAPRQRDDPVVLREGGVGHAGHQGRQEAGDSVAQETAADPLQDFGKSGKERGRG